MIVADSFNDGVLKLHFTPESGDIPENPGRPTMAKQDMFLRFPETWTRSTLHPDLLALAILLSVKPFSKRNVTLDFGVSAEFAKTAKRTLKVDVGPVDSKLRPRERIKGRPGLSFSGGVDSFAALAVMPANTACVFLDREQSPGMPPVKSLYRPDAAYAACAHAQKLGHPTTLVPTDLEHIRSPTGFPTDLAPAVPLILMADDLELDAVAWGTIAESAYRIGHRNFEEYYERPGYRGWAPLFEAVGLPIINPVAGVSEVGTSTIVNETGLSGFAQSCIRGDVGAPCMNCWKCFRKTLLDSAIRGSWPTNAELDRLFEVKEALYHLANFPIKHENVVAYIAQKYQGDHPQMRLLQQRVAIGTGDVSYLERWYERTAVEWPEEYREEISARLDRLLGRMSPSEAADFASWDLSPMLADSTKEHLARTTVQTLIEQSKARTDASASNRPIRSRVRRRALRPIRSGLRFMRRVVRRAARLTRR